MYIISMPNSLETNTSDIIVNSSTVNKQERGNEINVNISEKSRYFDADVEVPDATTNDVKKFCLSRGIMIKKLQTEYNKLKEEQNKTFIELESSRKAFRAITTELKRQLDTAKQRESVCLSKTLDLRLENEKLQVLLESKKCLVDKLRKELLSVKEMLKFAIKDICNVSRVSETSDAGYEEFLSSLRSPYGGQSPRSSRVRFADCLDNANDSSSMKKTFDRSPPTI